MSRYLGVQNYDDKVFSSWVEEFYKDSDFYNMGYWHEDTRNAKKACENLMEQLLAFLPEKKGNILDVACGKGATTRYLLRYYQPQEITGINISAKQLEKCWINAPNCQFIQMDATQLDFPENSFDTLICVEAAFHFKTREKFVQEAHRVLKPGGYLLLSDLLTYKELAKQVSHLTPENHISNLDEYRSLYLRSGFQNVELIDATQECSVRYYKRLLDFLQKKIAITWSGKIRFEATKRYFLSSMNATRYYLLVSAIKPLSRETTNA